MTERTRLAAQRHAWAAFLVAHARLLERVEAALQAAGLPPLAWYDVLWALENGPEGKLRMHELAERIVLSRSNLSRLADRLEKAGLIRREACAADRRGAYCAISDKGRDMRKAMWPVYRAEIDRWFGRYLTDAQARVIGDCMERIAAGAAGGA
ncbi:MAG TPA: MarR family transcriptional regulator [Casimicrobiaceae bacterium]|nr:MarR family transcriptional regulator [Casimicrobiaceae bacterium]